MNKKVYVYSFLFGLIFNALLLLMPYFFDKAFVIGQYLNTRNLLEVFIVSVPYLILSFVLFVLFLRIRNNTPTKENILKVVILHIVGFYIPIIFLMYIVFRALLNWRLF